MPATNVFTCSNHWRQPPSHDALHQTVVKGEQPGSLMRIAAMESGATPGAANTLQRFRNGLSSMIVTSTPFVFASKSRCYRSLKKL